MVVKYFDLILYSAVCIKFTSRSISYYELIFSVNFLLEAGGVKRPAAFLDEWIGAGDLSIRHVVDSCSRNWTIS